MLLYIFNYIFHIWNLTYVTNSSNKYTLVQSATEMALVCDHFIQVSTVEKLHEYFDAEGLLELALKLQETVVDLHTGRC